MAASPSVAPLNAQVSGHDLVYVRAADPAGEVIVVDAASGTVAGRAPFGVPSRDWSVVYRAEGSGGGTVIKAIDPLTGATLRERAVNGAQLELPSVGLLPEPAGLSPNGQWLVLQGRRGASSTQSTFVVVKTALSQAPTPIELGPDFVYDALSNNGGTLFLEERTYPGRPSGAGYRVRAYDVASRTLLEGNVADKGTVGEMSGTRVAALPSPDGVWMYSLYMRPDRPFIHAVNMSDRYSVCLFLPTGRATSSGEDDLAWTFVPSPDGKRAYAVNTLKGVVAAIDLVNVKLAGAVTLPFAAKADEPGALGRIARWFFPVAEAKSEGFAAAAVSPDGKTLYALGGFGDGIFAVDLESLTIVKRHLSALHNLVGLGVSADGASLYSTDGGGVLLRIDARSGDITARIPLPARANKILRVVSR